MCPSGECPTAQRSSTSYMISWLTQSIILPSTGQSWVARVQKERRSLCECAHKQGPRRDRTSTIHSSGPDLLEPHILRSLSNIKITSIHTSCAGCHVVCIDTDGAAWLFGRNEKSSLGNLTEGGEDLYVSENAPAKLTPQMLGAAKGVGFVHAAVGKNHTLLVGSNGQFWSAGANQAGQVSSSSSVVESLRPHHHLRWSS